MTRFLKNIILFGALAVVAYPILLLIWGMTMPQLMRPNLVYPKGWKGHLNTRLNEVPLHKNVDIVVIGSSHAYRGFDPRIFKERGLSMYNLGSSGQSPINGNVILNRYLDILNPKILIYVTSPASFYVDGVESSLDIIANDQNEFSSVKMAFKINHLKTYNALIYGFLSNGLGLDKDFTEAREISGDTYIDGGYVERNNVNKYPRTFEETRWTLKDKQLDAFKENLKLSVDRNISVILIQTPVSKALSRSYVGKEEYDKLMSTYAEYYDYNDFIDLNDTLHFYDSHHLNKAGVNLFNNKLLDDLDLKSRLD